MKKFMRLAGKVSPMMNLTAAKDARLGQKGSAVPPANMRVLVASIVCTKCLSD